MARVKICAVPDCKHPNPEGKARCEKCDAPLRGVPVTDEPTASDTAARAEENELRPPRGTSLEGATGAARAALEFPWGRTEVQDRLNIGRDPKFSPLAAQIESESEDYVSGRHAEFYLDDEGYLFIVDVGTYGKGSKNGTYVNGRKIEALKPFQLADGNEIEFSHHLTATVRLG